MYATPKTLYRACLLLAPLALVGGELHGCSPENRYEHSDAPEVGSTEFAIDLDYSSEEMFGFSIEQYLEDHAPHLLPHAEEISHVAGEYRISPRALIALMEQQSGAIANPDFPAKRPFRDLSDETGFLAQLRDLCTRLRKLEKATELRVVVSAPDDAIATVLPANDLPELGEIYQALFPGVVSQPKLRDKAFSAPIPMQFPWSIGESWRFGGAHGDSSGSSILSSLDFMQGSSSWGDPISVKVVASAAGRVKRHSSCYVSIVHSGTWSTGYYHLSDIMVSDGATVQANQPIAKYANTKSQALCDGGSSTGPHVHWTLYESNQKVSLNDKVLSGYTIHPGTSNYDTDCSRMYLTRNGTKVCPWTAVRNDGAVVNTTDSCPNDPNKTQPGQCGCGVAEGTCTPFMEIVTSPVAAGQAITVGYRNLTGNATDWAGMYPAGALDGGYLQYRYTGGATSGTLTFNGLAAGNYEARLFVNNSYERVARVAFTVGSMPITDNCPSDPNKTEPGQCGCGIAEGSCGAKTVSLGVNDTFVDSVNASRNYGAAPLLEIDSDPNVQRALIQPLGLSGVPARARVESAQLILQVVDAGSNVSVHKLTGAFGENSVTYANAPGAATAFATISGTVGSKVLDMTAIVQAWVNGEAALGIALYPTGTNGVDIASSEHSVASNRPTLVVTYRAP
jgi:murein DD-endopeptidase MepM/ murein hydrolase activator NlpD